MPLLNSIRLERDLETRLERLARATGRSKSYYVNRALEQQIQQLEDRFVAHRSARPAHEQRDRVVPLYELECALGVDD